MTTKNPRHAKQDLFTNAMGGGSILRSRDLALVKLPDTTLITTSTEMRRAQAWGRARDASASEQDDRASLLGQLEIMITKTGTEGTTTTRGEPTVIARLATQMQQGGMNLEDWLLPAELRDALLAVPLQSAP